MWSSRPPLSAIGAGVRTTVVLAGIFLAGCTVEPLNATRASGVSNVDSSTRQVLAQTQVDPVTTRVAQQVRNQLLFSMNGGQLQPGGRYRVKLAIEEENLSQFVETGSRTTTAAQVILRGRYALIDTQSPNSGEQTIDQGLRQSVSSYDRTSQSFANKRARRDAENRAAKQLARQIELAIAQKIAGN